MDLGKWGEDKAREFLEKKGYIHLKSNFKIRAGEIDLIMKKGDLTVFIEVKVRLKGKDTKNNSEKAFSYEKQRRFIKAVNFYLGRNWATGDYRIDLMTLYKEEQKLYIRHYANYELYYGLAKRLW